MDNVCNLYNLQLFCTRGLFVCGKSAKRSALSGLFEGMKTNLQARFYICIEQMTEVEVAHAPDGETYYTREKCLNTGQCEIASHKF